jgi:hypothetical protein
MGAYQAVDWLEYESQPPECHRAEIMAEKPKHRLTVRYTRRCKALSNRRSASIPSRPRAPVDPPGRLTYAGGFGARWPIDLGTGVL